MKYLNLLYLSALLFSCQPKTVEKDGGLIIDLNISNNATNESQIDSSVNIFKNRIENLYENNPQVILSSDKKSIQIKLPLVIDSVFVKDFIVRKGDFKTVETYNLPEIYKYFEDINKKLAQNQNYNYNFPVIMSHGTTDLPLFSILSPQPSGDGSLVNSPGIGVSMIRDTALVDSILRDVNLIELLPPDLECKWVRNGKNNYLWLIAIKKSKNQKIISSNMIADARTNKNEYTETDEVSFILKPEYVHVWSEMTRNNIGRSLAIMIDDDVFSYPNVVSEIIGGRSSISGQMTLEEAKALSAILKYGPIPVDFTVKRITKI